MLRPKRHDFPQRSSSVFSLILFLLDNNEKEMTEDLTVRTPDHSPHWTNDVAMTSTVDFTQRLQASQSANLPS